MRSLWAERRGRSDSPLGKAEWLVCSSELDLWVGPYTSCGCECWQGSAPSGSKEKHDFLLAAAQTYTCKYTPAGKRFTNTFKAFSQLDLLLDYYETRHQTFPSCRLESNRKWAPGPFWALPLGQKTSRQTEADLFLSHKKNLCCQKGKD